MKRESQEVGAGEEHRRNLCDCKGCRSTAAAGDTRTLEGVRRKKILRRTFGILLGEVVGDVRGEDVEPPVQSHTTSVVTPGKGPAVVLAAAAVLCGGGGDGRMQEDHSIALARKMGRELCVRRWQGRQRNRNWRGGELTKFLCALGREMDDVAGGRGEGGLVVGRVMAYRRQFWSGEKEKGGRYLGSIEWLDGGRVVAKGGDSVGSGCRRY